MKGLQFTWFLALNCNEQPWSLIDRDKSREAEGSDDEYLWCRCCCGTSVPLSRSCRAIIIYFDLKVVFKELFGTNLNLQKSEVSLLALQPHTVVDPAPTLEPLYMQLPDSEFQSISVATKLEGTVIVGVPIYPGALSPGSLPLLLMIMKLVYVKCQLNPENIYRMQLGKLLQIVSRNFKPLFGFLLQIVLCFIIARIRS
jgi:hypothetical protein